MKTKVASSPWVVGLGPILVRYLSLAESSVVGRQSSVVSRQQQLVS
ncbi:MAG TPA: hypothetical protein VFW96_12105 [Thermomicrobiales bacterium]|nr:hypothetical protein [Thermomicrobiales bacterium]